MLTIGEFSNICRVSTKTLRYYAEIGLRLPDEVNPENGYWYYSINQLENLRKGKSIMSYLEGIDVQLIEIPMMYLLSIRKNALEHEFSEEYGTCFGKLLRKMEEKKLTGGHPQADGYQKTKRQFEKDSDLTVMGKDRDTNNAY